MPIILPFKDKLPQIHPSAFIAENAVIIGDVVIGAESSVWFGCVIRGDVNNIIIGERTNIQDGTVIHVSSTTQGTYIGDDVTVGHMALVHACTIGNKVLVGMKACIMDDTQVEDEVIIGAGALVTSNKRVGKGQLWAGSPAKYMRDLREDDYKFLDISTSRYVKLREHYQ
ncbi:MAG: gamma carbonic anhydrase family protein [Alphaproteobacteria bacterium]|nr:gamma carbonic anhydrase family protein [Alphaproteobacteria bacterium]